MQLLNGMAASGTQDCPVSKAGPSPTPHPLCVAHDHVWVTEVGPRRMKNRVLEPDTQADNLRDLRQVTYHLCASTSLSLRERVYPLPWAPRYLNEVICVKCSVNDVLKKQLYPIQMALVEPLFCLSEDSRNVLSAIAF